MAWASARSVDDPEMPDMPAYGEHVLDWLFALGISDGDRPHNYTNLTSWADHIGLKLSSWELMTMCGCSADYVNAFITYSDDKKARPPYASEEAETEYKIRMEKQARRDWMGAI